MIRFLAAVAGMLILLAGTAAAEQPPNPKVKGERVFLKCFSCHTLNPATTNLPGPNLVGIIGRDTASLPGYGYSPAMRAFAVTNKRWTAESLDRYIADPMGVVPGTSMGFPGIHDARERKELIDYLRSKSQEANLAALVQARSH
jgi:cytochrome c